jgi:DNA-binding MarR family transcriptional regulator
MSDDRESPALPRTSGCTCLRLRKATRQVTQIYDQHLAEFGLTVTQFSLLGHLRSIPGVSIGALADILVMDPTSLTRALRPLERQGLVDLRSDPKDRRSRCLHITQSGHKTYERARPGWERAQEQLAQALGDDGAPHLNAVLDDLTSRLRTHSAKPVRIEPDQ